jgi:hypothetical protein
VDVPEIQAPEWKLTGIGADRERDVAAVLRGQGEASVTLYYVNSRNGGTITLIGRAVDISNFFPFDGEEIRISDHDAQFYRGGIDTDAAFLQWRVGATDVFLATDLAGSYTLEDFLDAASTVR